jgi:cardiolipin synthase
VTSLSELRRQALPEVVGVPRPGFRQSPHPGSRVTLLFDGPEIFPAMLERIAAAQRTIHLDNYIFRGSAIRLRLADALIGRLRAGVAVRVLTDGWALYATELWRRWAAGAEIRLFGARVWSSCAGISFAPTGSCSSGRQCGDRWALHRQWWAGIPGKREPWRDTACAVDGPAALAMDQAFGKLWRFAGASLDPAELPPRHLAGASAVRVLAGEPGGCAPARHPIPAGRRGGQRLDHRCYLIAPRGIYQAMIDGARAASTSGSRPGTSV